MPNTSIPDRVLILGANGRLGRELTQAFAAAGWDVVAHTRQTPFFESSSVDWIDTPLANIEEIAHKAAGARVVVNALNTPTEHVREQILLNRHAIAIATALRAILLFPGNMHTFGTKVPDIIDGHAASQPNTAYGRVRARIEAEIRTAPGLQSVIIRSGDFYGGPRGSASPLERALLSQLRKGVVRVLEPTAIRAWAYLPDLAHTYVTVASRRRELETHTSLVFEGHTVSASEMLTAVSRAAAAHDIITDSVRMKSISRPGLYLAGITDPAIRELGRDHHLWRRSLRMDGSRLRALGASAGTPLDTAVSQALAHIAAAC